MDRQAALPGNARRGDDEEPIGHLLGGRAAGLADVVAADRDGVDLGACPRRTRRCRRPGGREDSRDTPTSRGDELLEDVVLGRGVDPVPATPCLSATTKNMAWIEGRHGVDREEMRRAVGGDAVERFLPVERVIDRHPHPAHLALGARVIGNEPELRRQVEGDVSASWPWAMRYLKRAFVSASVPKPMYSRIVHARAVHVGMDPAREGVLPGIAEVAPVVEPRHVGGPVHGLHSNPSRYVASRSFLSPRGSAIDATPSRPPAGTLGSRTRSPGAGPPSGRRRAPPSPGAPPRRARGSFPPPRPRRRRRPRRGAAGAVDSTA